MQADFISEVWAHTQAQVRLSYWSKATFTKKYLGREQIDKVNIVETPGGFINPWN